MGEYLTATLPQVPSPAMEDREQKLIEKLRLIEALHAGAKTEGERDAAAHARERILTALAELAATAPPIEMRFSLPDEWRRRLFVALLRRYGIQPYRYRRQRYTTVMARAPQSFIEDTLWPEYLELSETLAAYLSDVTNRVIGEALEADASEPEVRSEPPQLGT